MDKTVLVGPDLALGERVLQALDADKFPVTAALWLLQQERTEDWKLVIASPLKEKLGPANAYLRLIKALSTEKPVSLADIPIRLESNHQPLIKGLRKLFGRAASVHGMRLGMHSIGGVWIDDAYVYRVKP